MEPTGAIADAINRTFGSLACFKEDFARMSSSVFSSWGWLVKTNDGRIESTFTMGRGNPMVNKQIPLLTCDFCEDAYYFDHRKIPRARRKPFSNWLTGPCSGAVRD